MEENILGASSGFNVCLLELDESQVSLLFQVHVSILKLLDND